MQSKTHDRITQLYELWYPNGKKNLPYVYIGKFLDAEVLAWWYQDDGHLKIVNNVAKKIILSTDSFTKEENIWLSQHLLKKFKLRFSIDG